MKNKHLIGLLWFCALLAFFSCSNKPPTDISIEDIKGLESLPVGHEISWGKRSSITKLDSARAVVKRPAKKRKQNSEKEAPVIDFHIGSRGKEKSETTTNQADNGSSVNTGKDKSENKQATNSGNKHKEKTSKGFPWWIIALILVLFLFLKFGKGLFKFWP